MQPLDIILLIVTLGSAFMGFRKGIIAQIGSIGGVIAAVLLCRMAGPWLAQVLAAGGVEQAKAMADAPVEPSYMQMVLARVILSIAGFVGVKIIAHFCRSLTHALCLGFLDRIAGALFSLFEWLLAMSLLLNFWLVLKPDTDWAQISSLGNHHAIEFVLQLAPGVLGWALA